MFLDNQAIYPEELDTKELIKSDKMEGLQLRIIYEQSGHAYPTCIAVNREDWKYYLSFFSRMYGCIFDIRKISISKDSADKIIDYIFPLSKWEIERKWPFVTDGNYLKIELNEICEVHITASTFNHNTVRDMIETVIDQLPDDNEQKVKHRQFKKPLKNAKNAKNEC